MQCMSDRFNRLEDDVDAARLQSVRVTGGTGNIFTNYHLFVLHADILHISSFMYVNPVVRRMCKVSKMFRYRLDSGSSMKI
jgi:hypothetical protein